VVEVAILEGVPHWRCVGEEVEVDETLFDLVHRACTTSAAASKTDRTFFVSALSSLRSCKFLSLLLLHFPRSF